MVHFVRAVGVTQLASQLFVAFMTWVWLQPDPLAWLSRIDTEVTYLIAAGSLVLLAALRRAPSTLQLLNFALFATSFSAALSLWGVSMHDRFPDFVSAALWAYGASWLGLLVYTVLSGHDFSLVGGYVLVLVWVIGVVVYYTFATTLVFSEGLTIALVIGLLLFYWVYDLAMILRRRTKSEIIPAVMDLYRDLLNMVGYPIRLMRMPRTWRRVPSRW